MQALCMVLGQGNRVGLVFFTMAVVKEADRYIKYLDRSVLQDRVITVEKVKS
jgi:hypothetical protein